MNLAYFAATYNCTDSADQAYGAGNYSTCDGKVVGAPNTGFETLNGSALSILLPLIVAVVLVAISVFVLRRKRTKQKS